jgi:3-oxoacyl-[acyl-carrier protein] reductase
MKISSQGKKVIVTGGSRGIGRAIAIAFAENGAHVGICSRGIDGLRAVEAELRLHGGKVFGKSCDVGDGAALASFIAEAATALGGIDILINNASGLGLTDDEVAGWPASTSIFSPLSARAALLFPIWKEREAAGSSISRRLRA